MVKEKQEKISIGPGTLLTPLPVIVLSCGEGEQTNLITLAWTGIINTKPPMLSFSIRPERFSFRLVAENPKVVVNLVDRSLTQVTDFCGVKSGSQLDKFAALGLKKQQLHEAYPSAIAASPVQLLCTIVSSHDLGTHTCFFASIDDVFVRQDLLNENGAVELAKIEFVTYSHGNYYQIGEWLGFFGYSIASEEKYKERKQRMIKSTPWHFPPVAVRPAQRIQSRNKNKYSRSKRAKKRS